MARAKTSKGQLPVAWHLPKKADRRREDGAVAFAARPFAYSTVAQRDLVELIALDGLSWSQIHRSIKFDPELKAIVARYVEEGYGDARARDHLFPHLR